MSSIAFVELGFDDGWKIAFYPFSSELYSVLPANRYPDLISIGQIVRPSLVDAGGSAPSASFTVNNSSGEHTLLIVDFLGIQARIKNKNGFPIFTGILESVDISESITGRIVA